MCKCIKKIWCKIFKCKEKAVFIHVDNSHLWSPIEIEILYKINEYRRSLNLNTLKPDKSHREAAIDRNVENSSLEKINHLGFPNATKYLGSRGIKAVGEVIGYKYTSAESIVIAWIKSESHRKILIDNWTYTGISVYNNGENYFCELFGK